MFSSLDRLKKALSPVKKEVPKERIIEKTKKECASNIAFLLQEVLNKREQKFEAASRVLDIFLCDSCCSLCQQFTPEEEKMFYGAQACSMLEILRELNEKPVGENIIAINVIKNTCLTFLFSAGYIQEDFEFNINEVEKLTEQMIIDTLKQFAKNIKNIGTSSEVIIKTALIWLDSGFVVPEDIGMTTEELKNLEYLLLVEPSTKLKQ